VTSGDYLQGFFLGTREALSEKDRWSVTLTLSEVSARSVGMLIALYERVVGLYASLVGINAYDQPGVEAGKKAAGGVISLQQRLVAALKAAPGKAFTAEEAAAASGGDPETAHKILEHLAANGALRKTLKDPWFKSTYAA
ncbi:MAG TPA: glucose-6-phosphate isomerase, partial [Opitutaceae bacterium]|nr:glucose-6-phosphate isomerase [Opitutaceae bacterium]